jgi:hypothetical protein
MGLAHLPPLYSTRVAWSLGDVGTLPLAHTVLRRGRAACGPLAAYRAAELQRAGEDARAVVVPSPSGIAGRWHAVVRRGNGAIEDPSKILRRRQLLGLGLGGLLTTAAKGAASYATGGASDLGLKALGQRTSLEEGAALLKGMARGKGKGAAPGPSAVPIPGVPGDGARPAPAPRAAARLRLPLSPGSTATIEVPLAIVGGRELRLSGPMPDVLGAAHRLTRGPLRPLVAPRTRLALAAANAAARTGRPRAVSALVSRAGYPDIARQVEAVVR